MPECRAQSEARRTPACVLVGTKETHVHLQKGSLRVPLCPHTVPASCSSGKLRFVAAGKVTLLGLGACLVAGEASGSGSGFVKSRCLNYMLI